MATLANTANTVYWRIITAKPNSKAVKIEKEITLKKIISQDI